MHSDITNYGVFRRLQRVLGVASCLCFPLCPVFASAHLPTLTRVTQIRHLTPEQAGLGYPVRIRGVITNDVPAPDFVIQDASGGVYVLGDRSHSFPHHLGDRVEVEGITGKGFAPVIQEESLHILGKGTLPKSLLYSFDELIGGQMDSQWAKIRGVVSSVIVDRISWHEAALNINLVTQGGQFEVRVPVFSSEPDTSSWIGSEVSVEGVCGSLSNASYQFVGLIFYVPRLRFIKVVGRVKEAPFAALLRFSPDRPVSDRVRVQGVVTYQQRGKALFLNSEGQSLRVLTQQDTLLNIGDLVEVQGFPQMGESKPILKDAVFRRLGHQTPPSPVELKISPPFERYDGSLVSASAILLGRQQQPDGLNMLLEQNGFAFTAIAPLGTSSDKLRSIPLKSELSIVGICLVRNGGVWHTPESFQLLIRSPEDVVVTHAPPWWNLRHSIWLLSVAMVILVAIFAWVIMLHGRLREQVNLYRQKLHSGAVLEERNRIAREIHDTLEQDLAGIILQLDLATDCFEHAVPVARRAVETAREMSRHGMLEARRSVWDMRCHLLENGDLAYALRQVAELLMQRNDTKVHMRVVGNSTRLEKSVELNLLRIGQEAMANAMKHARARSIRLELQYEPDKVHLAVTDDGTGFVSDAHALNGHFGLFDMQERAQALGSHLQIVTEPGSGTRVELEVIVKAC